MCEEKKTRSEFVIRAYFLRPKTQFRTRVMVGRKLLLVA